MKGEKSWKGKVERLKNNLENLSLKKNLIKKRTIETSF
jgi:hypothetical protein